MKDKDLKIEKIEVSHTSGVGEGRVQVLKGEGSGEDLDTCNTTLVSNTFLDTLVSVSHRFIQRMGVTEITNTPVCMCEWGV
jgi:hypothetical protein